MLQTLRQKPQYLALIFTLVIIVWLLSGLSGQQQDESHISVEKVISKVKVERFQAEPVHREVSLYGRTEPDKMATLNAEVAGQVEKIFTDRGQFAKEGQVLMSLDKNDLEAQLSSAKALLEQRQIEFKGAKALGKKGLQGESQMAQAKANLANAQAMLAQAQLALDNTQIRAPFSGIFNKRTVDRGDHLKFGDPVGEIVDLDPIVIKVNLSEQYRSQVKEGDAASVRLVDGHQAQGKIRYISSVSEQGTNTFPAEIELPNPNNHYQAGLSAEVDLLLESNLAIKLPPSLLSLSESGDIGVKSVENGVVKFTPIRMVKSDADYVWLSGFGESAEIIVLGQGFVRDGDTVAVEQGQ